MPTDSDSARPGLWPRCGASAAVFRGCEVLLIRRGQGALKGYWSLPGGHIEAGERAMAAALREVHEETNVTAELLGLVDIHEVVLRGDDGALVAHYLIAVFAGRWLQGTPQPAADAADARFVSLEGIGAYHLTEGAATLITRAWSMLKVDPS